MNADIIINKTQPGSALQDFQTLLDFIGTNGELVSKKQLVFSAKTLLELNQKMSHPIAHNKARPQQTTFPHIGVVYQCAKLLGFFHYTDEGTRKRVNLNSPAIESWYKLNVTEQYFTLMEEWFFGDKDDYHSFLQPIERVDWFQKSCLSKTQDYYQKMFSNEYKVGELIAGLELFGIISIKHDEPDAGGGWKIKSLKLSTTGQFVFKYLDKNYGNKFALHRFKSLLHLNEDFTGFFDIFLPFFPELRNTYAIKHENPNREGVYIFKVSLGRAWRRIAITHQATLEDLAAVILGAFNFQNDHLHSFSFLDTSGSKQEYAHPMNEGSATCTDQITLAELPLSIKASMTFIFDFGDWWEFTVLLEKVDTNQKLKGAEIIAQGGKAPEQYPDWDEE